MKYARKKHPLKRNQQIQQTAELNSEDFEGIKSAKEDFKISYFRKTRI